MRDRRRAAMAALASALVLLASGGGCGKSGSAESVPVGPEGIKLPPGVVEQGGLPADAPSRDDAGGKGLAAAEESAVLEAGGGRFTVTAATRRQDNSSVASEAIREVGGDYLELELVVENISDDLLSLSDFEFRLWSPGINTDDYGWRYPLGRPVGDNLIASVLFLQEDLKTVDFPLKVGEVLEDCFLLFDLNPKSVRVNPGFDPAGATFSVKKVRGSGSGEKGEISLDGLVKGK